MKPNRPRKSHFLPKFYLAGFTQSGDVSGDLFVVDRTTGRAWTSSPAKAATQRDLYVVDLGPTEDPDVAEKCLGALECRFSEVVRWLVANRRLPAGEGFDWFLNFVALMVTRIPRTRKVVAKAVDHGAKGELRSLFSTPEGWSRFKEVLANQGQQINDGEYEHFRRLAFSEDYSVDLDQTTHVQMMVKQLMDVLLPALAERNWSLGIAVDEALDFICSDVPVSVWPAVGVDPSSPITVLTRNTVLTFPITRRLIAIARYEGIKPVLGVKAEGVAMFNRWTLSEARQLFSPGPDFAYLRLDGTIGGKADLSV
jgi:hypothetical protein